jgi:disulfide bond formation protein DsbB
VIFIWSAYLGVRHAGVEWGFWAGPTDCAGGGVISDDGRPLLERLADAEPVVSCTEVQWRFAGLSFAGWNAVISAGVAIAALSAALRGLQRRPDAAAEGAAE